MAGNYSFGSLNSFWRGTKSKKRTQEGREWEGSGRKDKSKFEP